MSGFLSAGIVGGPDIPDSVVYQVQAEDFATPWPFSVGGVDMSVSGLTATTFGNGENAVSGDGIDDYGHVAGPQTLPQNRGFGLATTVAFSVDSGGEYLLGSEDSTSGEQFFFRSGTIGPQGSIEFNVRDSTGAKIAVYTDNTYDDGSLEPIIINKTGNTASDIQIYVGDMSAPVSTTTGVDNVFDHTAYSNSEDMGFWDLFFNGSNFGSYIDADVGVIEFNSGPYSESEREKFVSRRPEV